MVGGGGDSRNIFLPIEEGRSEIKYTEVHV